MPCSSCGANKPIVNKKYNVCDNCNSVRITGKSISERQTESAKKYKQKQVEKFRKKVSEESEVILNSSNKITRRRTPVKKQTIREAGIKSKLSQIKTSIELEAVQNNEYYCNGCGKSHLGLDKSHILSVGQFKHLELIKENIQLMCRSCHIIWESGTIEEQINLHCFADNVVFIYFYDQTSFNKFLTRIEEYNTWLVPGRDQEKINMVSEILTIIQEGIERAA